MSITPSREDLAAALNDAGGLRLVRIGHLERSKIYLTCDWQGQRLEFVASVLDVMQAATPTNPRSRARDVEAASIMRERLKRHEAWTEDQLRAEGLPLYYSAEWLRGALTRLGSYAEIERVYGYAETTTAGAGKRHGIEIKPRVVDDVKAKALEMLAAGQSAASIGRELGVSKMTVLRLKKGTTE